MGKPIASEIAFTKLYLGNMLSENGKVERWHDFRHTNLRLYKIIERLSIHDLEYLIHRIEANMKPKK